MLKRIIAAACLCAMMAETHASTLSGQQIGNLVAGATVEIETPLGTKLPIRYMRDGRLYGEAGGLASYLGTASDKGRWWVESDQLCHKWYRWFGSEPQCIRLSQAGRVIHWRSRDGYAGTATISVPPTVETVAAPQVAQPDPPRLVAPPQLVSPPGSAPEDRPAPPPVTAAGQPPQQTAKELAIQAAPATPALAAPAPAEAPPAPAAPTPNAAPPPQPQPEPKRVAQPTFRVVNVRSDDVLNIRSGPSADFDIVGGLLPGSRGIAITSACRAVWCPVQHRATSGWVNVAYLAPEESPPPLPRSSSLRGSVDTLPAPVLRDAPDAPRACLTEAARALLDRIERQFGAVQVISSCRPGALIPGTAHPSRHAAGNAVDFLAGSRKTAVVEWLVANHRDGGTMTYPGMDHIHVDVGPHFVSIANGPRWLSWRDGARDFPEPQTVGK